MRIKPTHDGPSFDVVVIVDPLSKGISGLVEVYHRGPRIFMNALELTVS